MRRVPYVPTPMDIVKRMLELAQVNRGESVYDLGAGDGRILIHAVREYEARAVGVEDNRARVFKAVRNLRSFGVDDKAKIISQDFLKADLRDASVVTLYLLPDANRALLPKLLAQLRRGTRIVTHDFPLPTIKPAAIERLNHNGEFHHIYLYHHATLGLRGTSHTLTSLSTCSTRG
jgi:cyclopropane fatty-acyl-phospholipid synthase-like methyltransferase